MDELKTDKKKKKQSTNRGNVMNFQYYETLQDKSNKYLTYLIEKIEPKFTIGELKIFLEDISKKSSKNKKDFVDIGEDYDTTADFSKLNLDQLKTLYQIFISREINDRFAVKWRFYQSFKYARDFVIENEKINRSNGEEQKIDLIIKTDDGKLIFVLCYDILDPNNFDEGKKLIKEFTEEQKNIPDYVIFATNKAYRNINLEKSIVIGDIEIKPELWVEWVDEDLRFRGEDLIIVNNTELKLAGFNFTSMDDLLDYVYEFSKGGQVAIFLQQDFLSEVINDNPEIELIWKGIMIKK